MFDINVTQPNIVIANKPFTQPITVTIIDKSTKQPPKNQVRMQSSSQVGALVVSAVFVKFVWNLYMMHNCT